MPEEMHSNIELSKYRYNDAKETYLNAKMSFDNGFFRDCINRSYYVAFYAMKAVLALAEIDFKRHKDVVAYFNKEYVATQIFPKSMGKKLGRLKQMREENDYDDFVIASKEEAESLLQTAEEFLEIVEEYLLEHYSTE